MKLRLLAAAAATALIAAAGSAHAGATLDAIKSRGVVNCGVNTGLVGFAQPDAQGKFAGLDVDVCKAVAAAVLGDGEKVKFVPTNAQQRFSALQSGEIDILSRNTTWTQTRDTALGLAFAGVTYYDGQGFMVAKKLGVKSARELNGATVCVQPGTTTELNLADYFRSQKIDFKPVVIQELTDIEKAFFEGRCDAYTTDASGLASTRAARAGNAADYVILPEIISKEPLGPIGPPRRLGTSSPTSCKLGPPTAMIEAEEYGITQANVEQMKNSADPEIKRMLGSTPGMGKNLGLPEDWLAKAIKSVGNYGEIFERNVGAKTPLKLDRGLNALWTDGGLMYAMPFR